MVKNFRSVSIVTAVVTAIGTSITYANSGNIWGDRAPFTRTACFFSVLAGSLLYANPESKYIYHFSIIDESSQGFFSKEYQYIMKVMRIRNSDKKSNEILATAAFKKKGESKYLLILSESLPIPSLDRVVMFERDKTHAGVWYIRTVDGASTGYRC